MSDTNSRKNETYQDPSEGIHDGTITNVSADGDTVDVVMKPGGRVLKDCIMGSDVAAGLLGFHIDHRPVTGTDVKVVVGNPSVVIACLNTTMPDGASSEHNTVTGTAAGKVKDTKTFGSTATRRNDRSPKPTDMLEGEYRISNALGIALSMMTTFAKLAAGDRAKVEVFLLNDMVRVVSRAFRHFSSFGDMQIYNDGRLNVRWDGSSYEHEALGLATAKTARGKLLKKGVPDYTQVDTVNSTGRWRFSQFVGFLGNFMHVFVTDPVAALSDTAIAAIGGPNHRSGKFHAHVGNDGTFLIQSCAEIALERVVRIAVPIEMKRNEDPTGVTAKQFEELDKSFLKFWDYGANLKNISHTAYQLREYARWLSSYHSLARFHQLASKEEHSDWKIPKESDIPAPEWTSQETDCETANPTMTGNNRYKDAYATIRLMRDGSIVAMEARGGALTMVDGCGQLSVPLDLTLEAGRNIRLIAGRDILAMARRNMELVSIVGGIKLKARTWLHGLCEWGSIWLKSDAVDLSFASAPTPDNSLEDPAPIVLEHAVILEATQGRLMATAARGAVLAATGSDATGRDAVVQSQHGTAKVLGGVNAEVRARTGNLMLGAAKSMLVFAAKAFWDLRAGMFDVNKQFTVVNGTINTVGVKAKVLSATDVIQGPAVGGPLPRGTGQHFNHILKLPEGTGAPTHPNSTDTAELDAFSAADPTIPVPFQNHPVFDFSPPADYVRPDIEMFESVTQQRIRTDAGDNYTTWTWANNTLKNTALFNGRNLPCVGKSAAQLIHPITAGEALHEPSETAPADMNVTTPLTQQAITFQFLKNS